MIEYVTSVTDVKCYYAYYNIAVGIIATAANMNIYSDASDVYYLNIEMLCRSQPSAIFSHH